MNYAKKEFHADAKGMLSGLRILDLSRLVSGNFLTAQLADFGAEVIKVETPKQGDPFRKWHGGGLSLHWKEYCRNKKSIALDLRQDEGKALLLKLVENADGLVENFRPGRMEEFGLGPDVLLKRNPKLVMLRISGFGQTGPYREHGGFGTLVEAMSGYAARSGFADREPVLPPLALADSIAGIQGALAMMMAFYHRDLHDGSGQVIDLSLLEPIYAVLGPEAANYKLTGKIKKRVGSASSTSSPRNVYQTGDGRWVALSASIPSMVRRLFKAIGRDDLNSDPRLQSHADRYAHRDELDKIIGGFIGARTLDENLDFFRTNEITVGPVYDVSQIVEDPHFAEREILVEVPDAELGTMLQHNVLPRFSGVPGEFVRAAPALGEHTNEVLRAAGLSEDEIAGLRSRNIVE